MVLACGWGAAAGAAAAGAASAFGAGAGAPPDAGALTLFGSSPSPAISAISSLTGTSAVPSGTTILARMPSSTASTSMVALSVSISAITSPDFTVSPSFFSHLARLPFSMVGDRAGIRILIGIAFMDPDLKGSVYGLRRAGIARIIQFGLNAGGDFGQSLLLGEL